MKDDHDGYKDEYDCNGNEFHNLDDDIHNDDEHEQRDDVCIMIMLCLIFVGLSLRYSNISVYSVSVGGRCDRL